MPTRERKQEYFQRMTVMLDSYAKILIVHCDHVGSQQLHMIRSALRGKAEILMGKNTLMRKVVNTFVKEREGHVVEALLPCLKGNIGLIFTNADFADIRKVIDQNRVPAVAKAGQIAECDVIVPPGPTGCDPGQTSWFQALNVPTKISKGQIEIVSELKLISKGNKVMLSEAALLQKLNIKPFSYGLILKLVYESGSVFTADVLDITQSVLETKFLTALTRLTCVGLSLGIPSVLTIPHTVARGVKRLIALSAAVGYSFEEMKEWDALLNMDPAELAKLQATTGSSAGGTGGAKGTAAAAEEKKPEEEKVEEVVLGGGDLFGDSKDGY